MKLFRQIWNDLKRGKNIEVSVTLILAIIVAVLGLTGTVLPDQLTSVTLAVLALLAFAMLGVTHRLISLETKMESKADEQLRLSFPKPSTLWEESLDVWIIGATQSLTISINYPQLQSILRRGGRIRILLLDPDGETHKLVPIQKYHPIKADEVQSKIRASLDRLRDLSLLSSDRCEVRILDYPLPFNIYAFDIDRAGGRVFAEYQTIKMDPGDLPKVTFAKEDGYWFEYYSKQLATIWDLGKVYKF